jgi:hypothetical protein
MLDTYFPLTNTGDGVEHLYDRHLFSICANGDWEVDDQWQVYVGAYFDQMEGWSIFAQVFLSYFFTSAPVKFSRSR